MECFHQFLAFSKLSGGSQVFSSSEHPAHLTKYLISCIRSLLRTQVIISFLKMCFTSHSKSPSIPSGSRGGCSLPGQLERRYGSKGDTWNIGCIFHCGDIASLKARFPLFSITLNGPSSFGLSFLVCRLVRMFFACGITRSRTAISCCCLAFQL